MWKLNALQTRIYRRQIWNATRHDQFFIESDWFATIDRFVESKAPWPLLFHRFDASGLVGRSAVDRRGLRKGQG